MRALVLCDDYWHPASVVRTGLEPLQGRGFEFDWIENARDWSADLMAGYPVVALVKSDNITAADRSPWIAEHVERAFQEYVRRGNGLLVVHSGTVCRELPVLRGVIGGAFDSHPPRCLVTIDPKQGHPLAEGCDPYSVKDEHYVMLLDDENADVFLTTVSEHGSQPGGWTRSEGAGRVCVLTPGHTAEAWLHPTFQTLLANSLRWCAGVSQTTG